MVVAVVSVAINKGENMNAIRFVESGTLEIINEFGEKTNEFVYAGLILAVDKVVRDQEEYNDVYLSDERQILGLSSDTFELMGPVPIEYINVVVEEEIKEETYESDTTEDE